MLSMNYVNDFCVKVYAYLYWCTKVFSKLKITWRTLTTVPASEFEYTNMGECMTIDNVDDKKNFFETAHALTLLG